jgi:hypothetical protein
MKTEARIRFNPVTKEIEIEGSEEFVKAYFNKIQKMISGVPSKTVREPQAVKITPVKKAIKEPKAAKPLPAKKAKKTAKKKSRARKVTNIDKVVGLIKGSAEGISTAELKEKTGLAESQIWNIVNRAAKAGKVKKIKRGVYGAA